MSDQGKLVKAYEKGWIAAARWAERDDLLADIGSSAYKEEQVEAIGDVQQTAVSMSNLKTDVARFRYAMETASAMGHDDFSNPFETLAAISEILDAALRYQRLEDERL